MNLLKRQKFIFLMIALLCFTLSISSFATQGMSNSTDNYRVGYMNSANNNDTLYDTIKNAFTTEYNKFSNTSYTGMPSSFVSKNGDYYVQNFNDANNQQASIYVGPAPYYKTYTVNNPMYGVLNSVGGVKAVGYPASNAFQYNGNYYQNFKNGYVYSSNGSNTGTFVRSRQVNGNGLVSNNATTLIPRYTRNATTNNTVGLNTPYNNTATPYNNSATNSAGTGTGYTGYYAGTGTGYTGNNGGVGTGTGYAGYNAGTGYNTGTGTGTTGYNAGAGTNYGRTATGTGTTTGYGKTTTGTGTRYGRTTTGTGTGTVNYGTGTTPNTTTTRTGPNANRVSNTTTAKTATPAVALITILIIAAIIVLVIILAARKRTDK